MSNIKEKLLSKSNSYTHYKNKVMDLDKENSKLQKEIKKLKKENKSLKKEMKNIKNDVHGQYREKYGIGLNFCYRNYEDYYFRDDFEDKLKEICSILPEESKNKFKWYLLRVLFINLTWKESLFTKEELQEQKLMETLKHDLDNEFKFLSGHGFHISDLNLTEEDKEFIKNKDLIDAGAYIGDTSLPLSKFTNKKVWAFEPFDESFDLLEEHVKINNIDNIVPVKKSVGSIDGEKTLFITGDDFSGITSKPDIRSWESWDELKVQECTVDQFVKENDLDLGYINVDVEGGELDLLNGAINTIKSQKPILAISIYHQASDFFDIIPWINNLGLGYEFELVKENPNYFLQETMVIARCKK